MEEKKSQIGNYLRNIVNPFLQPMVQQIAKNRPADIPRFIHKYVQKILIKQAESQNAARTDSQQQNEEEIKQLERKFQQKKKKKAQKKISRQGISAEVFGKYNEKKAFVPRVIAKSADTQKKIQDLINKSILFQALNKDDKEIIINAMEEKNAEPNDFIIKQGQQGDVLFIVSEGEFDCFKVIGGKQTYLKTYKAGDFFGELALMYNAPRAATIKCKSKGKLYGLDRQTFINIVQQAATKKRSSYLQVLSKVQILGQIDPYQKQQLCDILKEQYYKKNEYIVKQGEEGTRFYIVAEGKLVAQKVQNGVTKKVFQYKQGDYFGEIALVRNTVRQASVRTESDCRVVYIQRDAFKRILGPVQNILKRNQQKYKKYMANQKK